MSINAATIRTLYDYNYAINWLILDKAAQLDTEHYHAPSAFPQGSLHSTLRHILAAEWTWRMRAQQGISPPDLANNQYATLESLRAGWHEEEQDMRAFVHGLSDDDLNRPVRYSNTRGKPFENLLWHILQHVVLHGMQHRTEAAAMLTSYGHSPGDIDFIYFIRTPKQYERKQS